MKKIYIFFLLICFVSFTGCSKDVFKKYDERVIGTWRISDIDKHGFGGNISNLPFQEGEFTFADGGLLTYIGPGGVIFTGHWDIIKKTVDEDVRRELEIAVADHSNQIVLSESYDEMVFSGTDHFKTTIYSGSHSYVTHFRR